MPKLAGAVQGQTHLLLIRCYDWFTVSVIGRLRHGSYVAALLMAVLLVAPMIDCALLGDAGHLHPTHTSAAGHVTHSVSADLEHEVIDIFHDDCGPHIVHCIAKSVLPGPAAGLLVMQLLTLILSAVVVVATALWSTGGGMRGPPVACLPVADGRDILTRFCISRR
ncbi:hypothetical protein [Nocardia sputi]|uniref:hypothetical protein n=1 Tax=Nocardia sputi TaxID=2943705 RepID=UPI0020BE2875|nr:hypothetical protein [Nocardia sputi]